MRSRPSTPSAELRPVLSQSAREGRGAGRHAASHRWMGLGKCALAMSLVLGGPPAGLAAGGEALSVRLAEASSPADSGAMPNPPTTAELDCVIRPSEVVRLGTPEPGLLSAVHINRGDVVEAGEVVAELVSDAEATFVELSRARAESAAEIVAASSRVDMLRARLERNLQLERSRVVSAAAVEEIRTELLVAEQDVEAARSTQAQARLELQRAEELFSRRRIVSPVAGVVMERRLAPGEYFPETEHLAVVAVLDPLHIETFAPVALYGAIVEGETATVIPEDPIGGEHEAAVDVVDRVLDAASGTYGVRLQLGNPKHLIPAGINCRVFFRILHKAEPT